MTATRSAVRIAVQAMMPSCCCEPISLLSWRGDCRVCSARNRSNGTKRTHVRPEDLRHRPHPRLPRALDGEGAGARLRARSRSRSATPARARRSFSPSIRTGGCRSSSTTASCCSSRSPSRSISPRSIRPAGFIPARWKARRGPGSGACGRSPRSIAASTSGRCTPSACRRRSGPGQARRGAQGSGGAVQGARRRGERSSPICSAMTSPSPISTSPPSSAARSRWT